MISALRPYQQAAIAAVQDCWRKHRSVLVVSPTGTGKTVMFVVLAQLVRDQGRVLILAHREELVQQAVEKVRALTNLRVGIEMAEQRVFAVANQPFHSLQSTSLFPADGLCGAPDVVVASVATLGQPLRRAGFPWQDFGTIIVDEAHHAVASSWKTVLNCAPHARVVGFTATPDRHDEIGLRQVFESLAFQYDLRQAIEDKYLVPLHQQLIHVHSLDLSSVKVTAGDLDEHDLGRILCEEAPLHEMVAPLVKLAENRPTLVFAATVAHAVALRQVLRGYTQSAVEVVHGQMRSDHRRAILQQYHRGDVQFLVNCALLTEGFDAPATACIAVCRPTKSRALYAQIVGRGTRLAEGKNDCLVLDFRGNAGKHSLIDLIDLLGDGKSEYVQDSARKQIESGQTEVKTALLRGEQSEKEKQAEQTELAAQTERERQAHASLIQVEAVFTQHTVELDGSLSGYPLVQHLTRVRAKKLNRWEQKGSHKLDPFEWLGIERHPSDQPWRLEPRTLKQAEVLSRHGIDTKGLLRGDASDLIAGIAERAKKGLCTPRQAKYLALQGQSTDLTFEQAKQTIDRLMSRSRFWRGA